MSRAAPAVPLPAPPPLDPNASTLAVALGEERHLLEQLARVLRRQRVAVAENDIAGLDETSSGAQRILLTLGQARRRRTALVQLLRGGIATDPGLAALDTLPKAALTPEVASARDALRRAAAALADDLRAHRGVIQGAIDSGDRLIRALCGGGHAQPLYHRGPQGDGAAVPARLIDRQV